MIVKSLVDSDRNPKNREDARSDFQRLFNSFLGLPDDATKCDLVKIVHERLPTAVVENFLDEGVEWTELEKMLITRRTFTRRIKKNELLSVEESDRAVRVARLIAKAITIFSNKDKAMNWLRSSMKRFDGITPMEVMGTDAGGRLVEETLTQIDEGFFV